MQVTKRQLEREGQVIERSARDSRAGSLAGAEPHTKAIVHMARLFLFFIPIANVLWVPVVRSSFGGGINITYLDLLLVAGWMAAAIGLLTRSKAEKLPVAERRAWLIVLFANLPLILSPFASYLIADGDNLVPGILAHLKRIGLAAVIVPLCVQANLVKVRRLFLLSIVASGMLLYFGLPDWLGIEQEIHNLRTIITSSGRNASLLFNPNTVGFVTSVNILILISASERERSHRLFWFLLILSVGVSLLTFASSGSRTASLGLIIGFLYYVLKRRSSYLLVLVWLVILAVLVTTYTEAFRSSVIGLRWSEVTEGLQTVENLTTRVEYQRLALERSPEYPIGSGISSKFALQTDSVYFDYLSAMGYLGLASILLLFGFSWYSLRSGQIEVTLAKSVVLAVAVFSSSALGIATPFVSPLFFLVLGYGLSATQKPPNPTLSSP